ncbi:hypothetical protein HPB49_007754 [Dermacentor silvarum]|uniref:Uncharacterized protein n=1 Tax=Dermacentor silvarum TaxID=543639 RepID=A0ACB8CE02_DERSI|nr:hypothetical protein HPB49_007754 [Dermacentor silvarum]
MDVSPAEAFLVEHDHASAVRASSSSPSSTPTSSDASQACQATPTTQKQLKTNSSANALCSGPQQILENVCMKLRKEQLNVAITQICERVHCQNMDGELRMPPRKRPRSEGRKKRLHTYDSFTLTTLENCAHSFLHHSEIPTAQMITAELVSTNTEDLPTLQPTTIRRLLLDIGVKSGKRGRNSLLIEREDFLRWEHKFLY